MVIAVKRDDKIVVGLSACDSFINMSEKDLSLMENLPFWKVKGTSDCYVFAEELSLSVDLLRYNDYIFKNITDGNSIINNVVPKMKELLSKYSQVVDGKEWHNQMLIIKGNKLFTIGNYFTVSEADDFVAFSYEPYVIGGLSETCEKEISESILFALRSLNRTRCKNLFPIMLFDYQTKKKKFYYR